MIVEERRGPAYRTVFTKRCILVALLIVLLYVSLACLCIGTATPWNDEAWYTSPSLSLIKNGNTGTPFLESAGKFWTGINQRTYWVLPLYFFAQVPWFEIFGFSLTTARAFAVLWGLTALLCWSLIVFRLTSDIGMSLVTAAIVACDYQFVTQTSLARMDAMAIALTSLSILLFLSLRERNLLWAVALSQTAVVAAGLTHPSMGVPAFCVVLFITLYLDFRRIRFQHVLVAIVPFTVGAAFWWWYISPAPNLFRSQFFGNVTDIDRLGGFAHPFTAIRREIGRYLMMAGFGEGRSIATRLKAIPILIRLAAVAAVVAISATRRDRGIRTLLGLLAVYLLCMTFYENTKEVKYAINTIGVFDSLTAVGLVFLFRQGKLRRAISVIGAATLLLTSVTGLLYVGLVKDDYRREFLPASDFLKRTAQTNDLILASSEFGFPLGFNRNIVDDSSFTYNSHKVPKFIVISPGYEAVLHNYPALSVFVGRMLARNYKLVYSHDQYLIYEYGNRYSHARSSQTTP